MEYIVEKFSYRFIERHRLEAGSHLSCWAYAAQTYIRHFINCTKDKSISKAQCDGALRMQTARVHSLYWRHLFGALKAYWMTKSATLTYQWRARCHHLYPSTPLPLQKRFFGLNTKYGRSNTKDIRQWPDIPLIRGRLIIIIIVLCVAAVKILTSWTSMPMRLHKRNRKRRTLALRYAALCTCTCSGIVIRGETCVKY